MKNRFWKTLGIFVILVFGLGYWSFSLQAAGKRGRDLNIGLILNLSPSPGADGKAIPEIQKSMLTIFDASYGRKMVEVKLKNKSQASLDFLLYTGAVKELDHLIEIIGSASIKQTENDKQKGKVPYQFSGNVRIIDVASLTVAAQKEISFSGVGDTDDTPKSPTQIYDFIARHLIKEMLPFYNPNLMKKMSAKMAGDYFYEKKQCNRAYPIYKSLSETGFSFEEGEELQRRKTECEELGAMESIMTAPYSLKLEFVNLAKAYEKYFKTAFQKGNFEENFKKYSSKPVTLEVSYDEGKGAAPGEFLLKIYFDAKRYNIPRKLPDGKIGLNFSNLNGAIINLLNFRTLSLQQMPEEQKRLFSTFSTRMELYKANGDLVTFFVGIDKKKRVLAPMKMLIQASGYEKGEVRQANPAYAKHNIFALGSSIKPDGTETINMIAYKFFGIKPE